MAAELFDCDAFGGLLAGFTLRKSCDVVGKSTLRIATPFMYPDGSYIDLFLEQSVQLHKGDGPLFSGYLLSDLGETAAYLHSRKVIIKDSYRLIVKSICKRLNVEFENRQLQIKLDPDVIDQTADAMMRLGQACVRVSDLAYLKRQSSRSEFAGKVGASIRQMGLQPERGKFLPGDNGRDVYFDFLVKGPAKTSLLKTVSAATKDGAHAQFNEVLSRWVDLQSYRSKGTHKLLTVIQDKKWAYREDDLKRIGRFSDEIIAFPSDKERLRKAITAA